MMSDFRVHRGIDASSFSLVASSSEDDSDGEHTVMDSQGNLSTLFDFVQFQKKMLSFVHMMPEVRIAQKNCMESMYKRLLSYFRKMNKMHQVMTSLRSALGVYEQNAETFERFVQDLTSTERGLFVDLEFMRVQLLRRSDQLSENRKSYNRSLTRLFDMITQHDVENSKGLFDMTQQAQLEEDKSTDEALSQVGILKVYAEQLYKNWTRFEHSAMAKIQQQKLKLGFTVRVVEKVVISLIQAQWKMKKRREAEKRKTKLQRMSIVAVSKTASTAEKAAAAAEVKRIQQEQAKSSTTAYEEEEDDATADNALHALLHIQQEVDQRQDLDWLSVGCQTDPVSFQNPPSPVAKTKKKQKKKKERSSPVLPRRDSFRELVENDERMLYNTDGSEIFNAHIHEKRATPSPEDEVVSSGGEESDESLPDETYPPPAVLAYRQEQVDLAEQEEHRQEEEEAKEYALSAGISKADLHAAEKASEEAQAHLRDAQEAVDKEESDRQHQEQEGNTTSTIQQARAALPTSGRRRSGSLVRRKSGSRTHKRRNTVGHTAVNPLLAEMRGMLATHQEAQESRKQDQPHQQQKEEEDEEEEEEEEATDIVTDMPRGRVVSLMDDDDEEENSKSSLSFDTPEDLAAMESLMDYFFFVNDKDTKAGRMQEKRAKKRRKKLNKNFPDVYSTLVDLLRKQEEAKEKAAQLQNDAAIVLSQREHEGWVNATTLHDLHASGETAKPDLVRFPSEAKLLGMHRRESSIPSTPSRESPAPVVPRRVSEQREGGGDAAASNEDAPPAGTSASPEQQPSTEAPDLVRVTAYRKFENLSDDDDEQEEDEEDDSAVAGLLHRRLERKQSIHEANLMKYQSLELHPDVSFHGYKTKDELLRLISAQQHDKDVMLVSLQEQHALIAELRDEVESLRHGVLNKGSGSSSSSSRRLEIRPAMPGAVQASEQIQRHFRRQQELKQQANSTRRRGLTFQSEGVPSGLPPRQNSTSVEEQTDIVFRAASVLSKGSFSSHHHDRLERAETGLFELRKEYDNCVGHLQHYVEEVEQLRAQLAEKTNQGGNGKSTASSRRQSSMGDSSSYAFMQRLATSDDILLAAENDQLHRANSDYQSEISIMKDQVSRLSKTLDSHKVHAMRSGHRRSSSSRRGSLTASHGSQSAGGINTPAQAAAHDMPELELHSTEDFLSLEREFLLLKRNEQALERAHMEDQIRTDRLEREVASLKQRLALREQVLAGGGTVQDEKERSEDFKDRRLVAHAPAEEEITTSSRPVSAVSVVVKHKDDQDADGEDKKQKKKNTAPEYFVQRKKRMRVSHEKLERLRADRKRKEEAAREAKEQIRLRREADQALVDQAYSHDQLSASARAMLRYGQDAASSALNRQLDLPTDDLDAHKEFFAQQGAMEDPTGLHVPAPERSDGVIFLSPSGYRKRVIEGLDKYLVDGAVTIEDFLFGAQLSESTAYGNHTKKRLAPPTPHPSELARLRAAEEKQRGEHVVAPRNLSQVQREVYERRKKSVGIAGGSATLRTTGGGGSGFRLGGATSTEFAGLSNHMRATTHKKVQIAPPTSLGPINWTPRPQTAPRLDQSLKAVPAFSAPKRAPAPSSAALGGRALKARQQQTKELVKQYKITRHRWEPEKIRVAMSQNAKQTAKQ